MLLFEIAIYRRSSKSAHNFDILPIIVPMLRNALFDKTRPLIERHLPKRFDAMFELGNHMPYDRFVAFANMTVTIDDLADDRMDVDFEWNSVVF